MPSGVPFLARIVFGAVITAIVWLLTASDLVSRLPFAANLPKQTAEYISYVVLFALYVVSESRRYVEGRHVDDEHQTSLRQEAEQYRSLVRGGVTVSVSDRFKRHFKAVAESLSTWNRQIEVFTAADSAVLRELSERARGYGELGKSLAYGPHKASDLEWQVKYGLTTGEPYVAVVQGGTIWEFQRQKDVNVEEELQDRRSLANSIAEWSVTRKRLTQLGELEQQKTRVLGYLSAIEDAARIKRARGCVRCWDYKFKP